MIFTETLLVKCPTCGAWPMAALVPKGGYGQRDFRLKCAKCGHDEYGRLQRSASIERFPQQRQATG